MSLDPSTKLNRELLLHTLSFLSMEDLQKAQVTRAYKDLVDEAWFERVLAAAQLPEGQTAREFYQKREVKPLIDEVTQFASGVNQKETKSITIRFANRKDYIIYIILDCGGKRVTHEQTRVLPESPDYPIGVDSLLCNHENSPHSRDLYMGPKPFMDPGLPRLSISRDVRIRSFSTDLNHPLQRSIISVLEKRLQELAPHIFPELPVRDYYS